GASASWWSAARKMYLQGVRYVLIAKQTSLSPPTLVEFSTGPTPLIRTAADHRALSRYFYRCNRIGIRIYDSDNYVVYRLKASRLWKISCPAPRSPGSRRRRRPPPGWRGCGRPPRSEWPATATGSRARSQA